MDDKIYDKLKKVFARNAKKSTSYFIHATAAAAAAIIAVLPVPADAVALTIAEILMVIAIAARCGVTLKKEAARAFLKGAAGYGVGSVVAKALLELSHATGPFAYVIKLGVAVGVI